VEGGHSRGLMRQWSKKATFKGGHVRERVCGQKSLRSKESMVKRGCGQRRPWLKKDAMDVGCRSRERGHGRESGCSKRWLIEAVVEKEAVVKERGHTVYKELAVKKEAAVKERVCGQERGHGQTLRGRGQMKPPSKKEAAVE